MNRTLVVAATSIMVTSSVFAGSHLWDFNEVFSTPDGSIQFIELYVPTNANFETGLAGLKIKSAATGKQFTFPSNLTPPTGFKTLLIATSSFAALPGAPTPDFIIPPQFFGTNGDTLTFHVYDTWVIAPGALPLDCVTSLNRLSPPSANSPKNFAGVAGSVDACPKPSCPADLNGDGEVNGADMGLLLGSWGTFEPEYNLDGEGTIDAADLGILLGAWGACP